MVVTNCVDPFIAWKSYCNGIRMDVIIRTDVIIIVCDDKDMYLLNFENKGLQNYLLLLFFKNKK